MTSGQFTSFPVDDIFVDRAKRQRKELKDIPQLAQSISENGLIHPPVIKRDGELIVGERRWTAVKSLGWTHVPVQFVEDLSELELHAIELEENVGRVDITWQEQCLATERYHQLRLEQDSTWTIDNTAERLGMSTKTIYARRDVAKELENGNARVAAAPKFSTARNIIDRNSARKKASAVADIETKITGVERVAPLIHEDFHDWSAGYTGTPFNLIHCDFPYGVDMQNSDQGAGAGFGTYQDDLTTYRNLLASLSTSMSNVVADSAHLIFWFSMDYYEWTKKELERMGWKVSPFPLIWMKSDNTGIIPDANRGPRRIYETAFFGSRGDRLIHTAVSNAFAHPGRDKSIHMNEKPVAMLKHFMRMVCDEYSRVLDPTCGSANALKAASALGAPTVLGLERDEEFFSRAKEAYFQTEEPELGL